MTRRVGSSRWLGTTILAFIISASMIMLPEMQHPAQAYKAEARSIQGRAAIYGALTTVAVVVVVYIIIIVAFVHETHTTTYYSITPSEL